MKFLKLATFIGEAVLMWRAYDSFNFHIAKEAIAFMGKRPEAKETEDEYQIFGNVHFIKK